MEETGEACEPERGVNSGSSLICCRRSGEAFKRNQSDESGDTATCAWERARAFIVPKRKALQFGQLQFHWGKPPPAAEPRTLTRIRFSGDSEWVGVDSRTRVQRWRRS